MKRKFLSRVILSFLACFLIPSALIPVVLGLEVRIEDPLFWLMLIVGPMIMVGLLVLFIKLLPKRLSIPHKILFAMGYLFMLNIIAFQAEDLWKSIATGIFLGGSMIGIYAFMSCLQRNPEETRKARSFSSGFFYFRRKNE